MQIDDSDARERAGVDVRCVRACEFSNARRRQVNFDNARHGFGDIAHHGSYSDVPIIWWFRSDSLITVGTDGLPGIVQEAGALLHVDARKADGRAVQHVIYCPEGGAEDVEDTWGSRRSLEDGVCFVEGEGKGC